MKPHLRVRTVILSDLHLGSTDCRIDELNHFLRHVRCDRLILNGDVVDALQIVRGGTWTTAHTKFVRTVLKQLDKRDTEIVYVRGNHDDGLRSVLPLALGRLQFVDEFVHYGVRGRYLVLHGDIFDSTMTAGVLAAIGASSYGVLLRLNRLYNGWRRLQGREYWSLSRAVKDRLGEARNHVERFETFVADVARSRGYDGVICGHIHVPADRHIDGVHYLNSGDWVESLTAVVEHFDGRLEVLPYTTFEREYAAPTSSQTAEIEEWMEPLAGVMAG